MEDTQVQIIRWWGAEEVALDSGRLLIPSRWRSEITRLYALPWFPHQPEYIKLFSPQRWARIDEVLRQIGLADREKAYIARLLSFYVEELHPDKVGRIRLPQRILDAAGIQNRAVLVGFGDHFELWSADRFFAVIKQIQVNEKTIQELGI